MKPRSPIERMVDEACRCPTCGALPEHQRPPQPEPIPDDHVSLGMSMRRWKDLMKDDALKLSAEEIAAGWHWCQEMDDLLCNFNDPEDAKICTDACKGK